MHCLGFIENNQRLPCMYSSLVPFSLQQMFLPWLHALDTAQLPAVASLIQPCDLTNATPHKPTADIE